MAQNYSQGYYWYYATRDEALNWPIAPGNMLTFKDPDGKHYYEKTLGWNPCEGVQFKEYKIEQPVEAVKQDATPKQVENPDIYQLLNDMRLEMSSMKLQMNDLSRNQHNKPYEKKGENK